MRAEARAARATDQNVQIVNISDAWKGARARGGWHAIEDGSARSPSGP